MLWINIRVEYSVLSFAGHIPVSISNPVEGVVTGTRDVAEVGENLQQWSRLKIRLNALSSVNYSAKQYIIIIYDIR